MSTCATKLIPIDRSRPPSKRLEPRSCLRTESRAWWVITGSGATTAIVAPSESFMSCSCLRTAALRLPALDPLAADELRHRHQRRQVGQAVEKGHGENAHAADALRFRDPAAERQGVEAELQRRGRGVEA